MDDQDDEQLDIHHQMVLEEQHHNDSLDETLTLVVGEFDEADDQVQFDKMGNFLQIQVMVVQVQVILYQVLLLLMREVEVDEHLSLQQQVQGEFDEAVLVVQLMQMVQMGLQILVEVVDELDGAALHFQVE